MRVLICQVGGGGFESGRIRQLNPRSAAGVALIFCKPRLGLSDHSSRSRIARLFFREGLGACFVVRSR